MNKAQTGISTVVIVEDDAAVLQSMMKILLRAPGVECVGGYLSAEEALREVPAKAPKIVLMDINLPEMDGVECVRQLLPRTPGTQFLMLTVHDDTEAIFDSLTAGATGYLLKPVRTQELLAAIKDVTMGGSPMTSNIARKVVQSFKQSPSPVDEATNLSKREKEILDALASGDLYKEIADRLAISYSTVHTHIARIYQKLHVRSRGQAVAKHRGL